MDPINHLQRGSMAQQTTSLTNFDQLNHSGFGGQARFSDLSLSGTIQGFPMMQLSKDHPHSDILCDESEEHEYTMQMFEL